MLNFVNALFFIAVIGSRGEENGDHRMVHVLTGSNARNQGQVSLIVIHATAWFTMEKLIVRENVTSMRYL